MPNLNEFIGPKPEKSHLDNLEKIIGMKPCSKCDQDSSEWFWNETDLTMTWTCSNGHTNHFRVN